MFGFLVRNHRVRLALTQENLAERTGLNPRSIRDIETGRTARARASTVRLLAAALALNGPEREEFYAAAALASRSPVAPPVTEATAPDGKGQPAPFIKPCRLPPDLPDYTGNVATLAAIRAVLTATPPQPRNSPAVVISGQGGVGKTSLAVHIAHQVAELFPDGQLFISFRGIEPEQATTMDALARALRCFGDDEPPVANLEACIDRYRAHLDGRRVLVVLDDVTGSAQVRPFIPIGPGSAILVSTKARLTALSGVRHMELDLLDGSDALMLLRRIVGNERIDAEPEAVRALIQHCAGLPLALRIVGARLAARRHWSVDQLVARMSDERHRLDELAVDDLAVRSGLAVSYRNLNPQAQRALHGIAYLDPPDFAVWTMAALLEVDLVEAEHAVEQLLDMRLVEVVALGGIASRYRMHDLVRLYAREQALKTESESDLRSAVGRAICLGLRQVERRSEQLPIAVPRLYRLAAPITVDPALTQLAVTAGPEWFDAEESSLVAAVERAALLGLEDLACALADALIFASFAVRNNFSGWNRAHRAALVAARATGNVHAEAVIECGLGQLRYKEDLFADAKRHFERALTLFQQERDRRGETVTMNGLATVCRERGEHSSALLFHTQAGEALERAGDDEGAAHAHYGIGFVHRELGDDVKAIENLRRALELYRRVRHVRGEAISIRGIGLVHRARGELDAAERYCTRAHHLAIGTGDRLLPAYTAQGLAKVWLRQGAPERAQPLLTQGLTICSALRDRQGTALIRRTIGEMHLTAGNYTSALEYLNEASRTWNALGLDLWQARTARDLGAAHAALGNARDAHSAWESAQLIFDRFGTRERTELISWRRQWGCSCAPEKTRDEDEM